MHRLTPHSGYILASVQRALLQSYLALNTRRSLASQAPAPAPGPTPAPTAAAATCRVSDTLHGSHLQAALASLDPFSAEDVLGQPCNVFRNPPSLCKAKFRRALAVAFQLVRDASGSVPSSPGCCFSGPLKRRECPSMSCWPGSLRVFRVVELHRCVPHLMRLGRLASAIPCPRMAQHMDHVGAPSG